MQLEDLSSANLNLGHTILSRILFKCDTNARIFLVGFSTHEPRKALDILRRTRSFKCNICRGLSQGKQITSQALNFDSVLRCAKAKAMSLCRDLK